LLTGSTSLDAVVLAVLVAASLVAGWSARYGP
jgi:hypothetical protein